MLTQKKTVELNFFVKVLLVPKSVQTDNGPNKPQDP